MRRFEMSDGKRRVDRRNVLAGLCSAPLFMGASKADESAPLFSHGALADNLVAKGFHKFGAGIKLPTTTLLSEREHHTLSDLGGLPILVSLWAEWCTPCLVEAADFATLSARYRPQGFGFLAVLTGSAKKLNFREAESLLRSKGATLPLWIEPDGGHAVMRALASAPSGETSVPCNLLFDAQGNLRGRSFGSITIRTVENSGLATEQAKAPSLAAPLHTVWMTPAGDQFIKAIIGGALS